MQLILQLRVCEKNNKILMISLVKQKVVYQKNKLTRKIIITLDKIFMIQCNRKHQSKQ